MCRIGQKLVDFVKIVKTKCQDSKPMKPVVIQKGWSKVRVYECPLKRGDNEYMTYIVAWYVGKKRMRRGFASLEFAKRELNRIHKEARATLLDLFPANLYGDAVFDEDTFNSVKPDWSALYDAIQAQYRRELTPIIGFVFAESAENLELTRAFAVADDIVTDSSENWARRWIQTLATDMTQTDQRQIDRYIAEYRADPEVGLEWLRERLGRIVSPSRAEMVASTEITRANYEGEAFIANQLRNEGIDLVAVWFTAVDERVCPICGANHNKPRGEGWQLPPPAHPRCRCWVNWVEPQFLPEYLRDNE